MVRRVFEGTTEAIFSVGCGKAFVSAYELQRHLRRHAPQVRIFFPLPTSPVSFSLSLPLTRHFLTGFGILLSQSIPPTDPRDRASADRPYACNAPSVGLLVSLSDAF